MKKSTKILVLLLSLTLILAGLVIAASAEESVSGATYVDANGATQTASDLATAIANAKEGTTVTLTGDTTVAASIDVTKTITIDLNGYTLTTTCNNVFKTDTNHKNFTIKGNGKITATGILINNTKKNFTQNFTIEGDEKGIVITHDGTTSKSLLYASSGNWKLSNVNITSTNIGKSYLIQTASKGSMHSLVNYEFNSVKINAKNAETAGTDEIVTSGTYSASILRMGGRATATLNYCNWGGNVAAFAFEGQVDDLDIDGDGNKTEYMQTGDFLKINNSYINMSRGYTSDNKNDEIGIFGAYGSIGGNIIVTDSQLLSSFRPVLLNNTYNNGAVILNNSILGQNGTNKSQLTRSANVVFNEGSALVYTHSNYLAGNEGYSVKFSKGARMNANGYLSLITDGKTGVSSNTSANIAQYADGTSIKNSTTYKIVYDPQGSTDYPYVVVDYDYVSVDTPAYEYSLTSKLADSDTVWNGAGSYGNITSVNNNAYWKFISSGSKNSNGSVPEFLFQSASITENAYDVVVVETDFAGDVFGGFSLFRFGLQTTGKNNGLFKVKNDGTVDYGYFTPAEGAPTKLSLGEWHRVTIIADIKNANTIYCYIDGTYIGSRAINSEGPKVSGSTGPRFSVDGVTDPNSSLYVDNVSVRGYGDGTGSALTDNGAKFLSVNGGKAVNKGIVASDTVKTALGYPVATLNDLPGATVSLNRDIDLVQTITEDGVKIATNGYALKYTKESLPTYITLDNEGNHTYYDFNTAHGGVNYKFFTGNYNNADQLADPAYWTEAFAKLGHDVSALCDYTKLETLKDIVIDNHWYNAVPNGWSTEMGSLNAENVGVLYPEDVEGYDGSTVALYPSYDFNLAYVFVVLNSDGSFNRGLSKKPDGGSILSNGQVFGSGLKAVMLAYGETLVLQTDFDVQSSFNNVWNQGSKDSGAVDKTLSIDFNGHVVRVDSNLNQNGSSYKNAEVVITTGTGEIVNVYSSYPGAKLENYGVKDGKVTGGQLFNFSSGTKEFITDETTEQNTALNVGTVTVNGKTIPGSNLTLEASVIVNAYYGDSTCKINIDGVTAVKNASDFTGLFVNRLYYGELNVTNCTIVDTLGGGIVDGHTEGIEDTDNDGTLELTDTRALAKCLFDNCTIIVNNDGGNIVKNNYSFKSLTFKNCTTNGRLNGSNLKDVVVLGNGNAYFSTNVNNLTDNAVKANWNNGMTLGGVDTITVQTFSLNPEVEVTSRDWDYITTSYVIAINGYEGEADQVLPTLSTKTVNEADAFEVTFKGIGDNKDTTELYANGGKIVSVPTPESYVGTIVTFTTDGTYDKEVVTVVTEPAVYTPNFVAKANITGLKANLSLYANFNINLYIPASYKDYVTVADYNYAEVNVDGVDYLQVTAEQLCSNAADAVVFTLNVSEAGYVTDANVSVSIVSYATSILVDSKATFTDSDKVLMCYMLNYANEAEKFFDGAANDSIATLLTTYSAYTAKYNYVKNYDDKNVTNTNLSAAFNSATVSLESAPAFVLNLKDGFVGTVTVKYGENNVRTYNVTKDTQRAITIEGMKVYNFGTYLEISAVGTIGETEINITDGKYTLDTFAAYHVANAADENSATKDLSLEALDLIDALSAYAEVAEQYKLGTLEAVINPPVAE